MLSYIIFELQALSLLNQIGYAIYCTQKIGALEHFLAISNSDFVSLKDSDL